MLTRILGRVALAGVGVMALTGCTRAQQGYSPTQGYGSRQGQSAQQPRSAGAPARTGAMQTRTIQDPVWGMPAATATMPTGWKFDGFATHYNTCISENPGLRWAASSPDGANVQMYPTITYYYNQNGQVNQMQQQQGCLVSAHFKTEDFMKNVVAPQLRPGVTPQVQVGTDIPAMYRNEVQQLRQMDQSSMQQGFFQHTDAAFGLMEMDYTRGNTMMAEVFTGFFVCTQNGGRGMPASVRCTIENPMTVTLPKDRLSTASTLPVSVKLSAAWDKRGADEAGQRGAQALAQNQQTIDANRRAQIARGNQALANGKAQYDAGVARNKATNDAMHESMQNSIRAVGDQDIYSDPSTGKSYQVSNQYSHTYVGNDGRTVLQTNSSYAPGPDTMWQELQPR